MLNEFKNFHDELLKGYHTIPTNKEQQLFILKTLLSKNTQEKVEKILGTCHKTIKRKLNKETKERKGI